MSALANGFSGWLGRRSETQEESAAVEQEQASTTTRTGGSGGRAPVVVWEAANLMEAQIVKGRLVSEGIPATLRGESLGQIYGLTSGKLASTDVLVPALLAEKARQILETKVEWSFEEAAEEMFSSEENNAPNERE